MPFAKSWDTERLIVQEDKKESKTEANLAQVSSTQAGTSQVGGSDSDSSVFSFSVTAPTIGYLGDSEWMIDTGATYHVCPNRNWFFSFEKLDGYSFVRGDNRPCHMEGIGIVLVKMFDEMVRELMDVRYILQLKRNLISVGTLKALGLKVSIEMVFSR